MTDKDRIKTAIEMAVQYGGIDGDHHKAWVIDQMVRILAGDSYAEIVREACDGKDGPETYTWETGATAMTKAHKTELHLMAEDRELSAPYRKAAADVVAEIARLRALIAAPGDGEIEALVGHREQAYQSYINEVTPNGNTRMDNITLSNGTSEKRQRHIATQVDMAFQAGWSAALTALQADLAAAVARAEKAEGALKKVKSVSTHSEGHNSAPLVRLAQRITAIVEAALPDAKGAK